MHELSICGSIASIAERRAGGREVRAIHIRIGQLRQVVPDTLLFCWDLLVADTALAGSTLELQTVRARIRCRACDHTAELGALPVFICGACRGTDTEVVSGEEFEITALDLAEGAST